MNILLAGDFAEDERDAWLGLLKQHLAQDDVHLPGASFDPRTIDVAVVANPPAGTLAGCDRLRLIQSLWAGVDRLLRDPGLPVGVPLARMVDPTMTRAMVETAQWAVVSLHRGFFRYAQQQRHGLWSQLPQRRADEVAVLLLGYGEMGRAVADRLAASGYRVTAWRQGGGPARAAGLDVAKPGLAGVALLQGDSALRPALAAAEIVVNLLPLTDSTRDLIDSGFLDAMPGGSALVNLARGAHVVQDDLLAALDRGHLAHAVLDVFQTEPLPMGSPLWSRADVTVLPHAAALTDRHTAVALVLRNIEALRADMPLSHLVDRARGY